MTPLYFGRAERPLFGLHHPPRGEPCGVGVVLCHPAPQEYMRSFWMLRRLASQLAERGHPVLRFDYGGTGDSAGGLLDFTGLDAWRADLRTAVAELGERCGGLPISVVGLGLGASLALSCPELSLRDLVLWDPVVHGGPYVARLRGLHAQRHLEVATAGEEPELLGFPFPRALERELSALDLINAPWCQAERIFVLDSDPASEVRALGAMLDAAGLRMEYGALPDPTAPADHHALNVSMGAGASLQAVVERLGRPLP